MRGVVSVLAAIGGRAAWRWWAPAGVFVGLVLLMRLRSLAFEHSGQSSYLSASWAFLIVVFFHFGLLWRATPFALALGHRRGVVYLVAALAMTVLSLSVGWAGLLLARLEAAIVGPDAPRMFLALEEFAEAQSSLGVYALAVLMAAIAIGGLRWGLSGAVVSFIGAALLYSALLSAIDDLPTAQGLAGVAGMMLLMLGLGWRIYRKVPV